MNNCKNCNCGCATINCSPCPCPCHTPSQEEPWVAEFDKQFFAGGGIFKEMYKYTNGDYKVLTTEKKIKAFIQKTLEADRKAQADAILEKVREAKDQIVKKKETVDFWIGCHAALQEIEEEIRKMMG